MHLQHNELPWHWGSHCSCRDTSIRGEPTARCIARPSCVAVRGLALGRLAGEWVLHMQLVQHVIIRAACAGGFCGLGINYLPSRILIYLPAPHLDATLGSERLPSCCT